MKRLISIGIIIICWISSIQAQNYKVTGTIVDSSSIDPLIGATISLVQKEDIAIKHYCTADYDGNFILEKVKPGNYHLRITYVGYEPWSGNTTVNNKDVDFGKINLIPNVFALAEFQVSTASLAVQLKQDTTQYNAISYKTNPDATAENLLEKMPGMIKENGRMQSQGEDIKQVLVDGQPFFGDDPNAALKNIPSEIIQKIQVFDQQSEQARFTDFDDGNTIKTINIITKAEYRNGTFGKIYGGYGDQEKHSFGGVVNIFNGDQRITLLGQSNNINQQNFATEDLAGIMSSSGGGRERRGGGSKGGGRPGSGSSGGDVNDFLIGEQNGITSTNAFGINYSDKWSEKIDFTASYFFNQSKNTSNIDLLRNYFSSADTGQQYSEIETSESENINHRFNLKLNYKINRNNSIVINPKFTLQSNTGFSDLTGQTMLSDSLLNSTINNFKSDVFVWNFSNQILWRHKFDKRGRSLSINLNQNITNNTAESFLNAQNNYYETVQFDTIIQPSELDQFEQTYSARVVYTEPLWQGASLQLNYNPSYSINNSQKETFNFNPSSESYSLLDSTFSNSAESKYFKNTIGAGLRLNKGKSMFILNGSFQLAQLDIDHTLPFSSNLNKSYTSFLPSAMWRYNIGDNKNLQFFYRTYTSAPSISQLQEVLDNTNPLQLTMGNENLDQQYQHNIFIKYSAANTVKNTLFFAMLSGSLVNNYIANNTTIAYKEITTAEGITLPSGSQLIRPENLNGYYNIRGLLTYGIPIVKLKSNLNLSISSNFSQTPGIINDELNSVQSPNFGFGMVLSSNISEKLDFTFGSSSSLNYTFNSLNSVYNTKYFSQTSRFKIYWNLWKDIIFRTEVQHQYYSGFDEDFDSEYFLWNMSLGLKMFKNKKGELLLSVYDILDQNNSIERVSTETYIQDTETQVLNRYAMLTFKYSFTKFKPAG